MVGGIHALYTTVGRSLLAAHAGIHGPFIVSSACTVFVHQNRFLSVGKRHGFVDSLRCLLINFRELEYPVDPLALLQVASPTSIEIARGTRSVIPNSFLESIPATGRLRNALIGCGAHDEWTCVRVLG